MTPEQKALRLIQIADEIGGAQNLLHVGEMAVEAMAHEEKKALAELLSAIRERLETAANLLSTDLAA